MKKTHTIPDFFIEKALYYAKQFSHCIYLNGNNYEHGFTNVLAFESVNLFTVKTDNNFEHLKAFTKTCKRNCYGYFSYDLKNELEKLQSKHTNHIEFPLLSFFEPKHELYFKNDLVIIDSPIAQELFDKIKQIKLPTNKKLKTPFFAKVTKDEYLKTIGSIKKSIKEGDIYELNYCMEFFNSTIEIDPILTYQKLTKLSATPFSCFVKTNDSFLMSASPERFLRKEGNKITSEPIKGTAKRGKTNQEDELNKQKLRADEKEQAENLMIVDLVRNDLARTAKTGTVKVEELFGIYTFPQVHQMISRISSELKDNVHFIDAIKNAFPMGSMTGAPKIKAMELIEKYEKSYRGLFSGAVGFISPSGDFDFNVIIRSILFNQKKSYLSFQVGSAITYDSIGDQEYDECLLKAKAIIECLSS